MMDDWEKVLMAAIEAGEIIQMCVEDDDGSTAWAVVDPTDKTCTLYDEQTPGIRTYPSDAVN